MAFFDFLKKRAASAVPEHLDIAEDAGILFQPIDGEIIPLSEIGDGVFSEGILGDGCGLIPTGEAVYAPVSGVISVVAASKHAVGIEADGVEVLIHVGMETVSMNGAGFDVKVKLGDTVKAGQLLMTFSLAQIEKTEGVRSTSAVLITNSDELSGLEVLHTGHGKAGDKLFMVKSK